MNLKGITNLFNKIFSVTKKPIIKDNTILVWEPCSQNHAEVVPGYVKYLLDLGYQVSVCVEPQHIKNGLFSRFEGNEHLFFNNLTSQNICKYLKKSDLSNLKGILVTTVGKLCNHAHYEQIYECFNNTISESKLYFVEHKAKEAIDQGNWNEKFITLRKLNYKGANSVVVNPFYFGKKVQVTQKNKLVNFITIGTLRAGKKDTSLITNAILKLHQKGITNFKVTVVGKGHLKNIPKEIRKYFDIKGQLPFCKMYDEIEKADFILTSYDNNNPEHMRYTKYQTSGNFQLVYGFTKPIITVMDFAQINGFNDENSILYDNNEDYPDAMKRAIELSDDEYKNMQQNLKNYVNNLYNASLQNLRELINGK